MQLYIYMFMQNHNDDTIIKTSDTVLFEKYVPLTLLKGFEKGYSRFYCERELETEQNCNILTPTLMAINVVPFSFSRAAQPEARGPTQLGGGFLYHNLSSTHLISNSLTFCLTELYNSSIAHSISPHDWPSEMCHFRCLWNGMFHCHRAEITDMQFTGHSFPVHQSMPVSWDFTLPHIVSQVCLRDFFS